MPFTSIRATDLLLDAETAIASVPIHLVAMGKPEAELAALPHSARSWLEVTGFNGAVGTHALVPGSTGELAAVVLGVGEVAPPKRPDAKLIGLLPPLLRQGTFHLARTTDLDWELATVAWGLGAYRFDRYKAAKGAGPARLVLPAGVDGKRVRAAVDAVWLGRDLINTPANDMGPAELERAARALAELHGATLTAVVGDALLDANLPLIHAVGRASTRPPRLVDMSWGRADAPRITIIGKGICFDTGGLDIKPSSAMLLMKKDMGGAASALALAHMIMSAGLDLRLRVLLAIAENAISGNAFRPGDVIRSRSGLTVEIGNTDAEGRLVLADAIALADEEVPDLIVTLATLTGAARVALGPDLPPCFTDDEALAAAIADAGRAVADPTWRLPLTTPYESWLDSPVADLGNVAEGGFAGAIVGAMFLKRFVRKARRFAHFDIYGWRPQPRPLGPKGGEPQVARALFEVLRRERGAA